MSVVDTKLAPAQRAHYLSEVRAHLPAFLSAATTEQEDPVGDVSDLLNLSRRDLDRVVSVHVGLSPEVRAFVFALPMGLRSPITSSIRPRVPTQAVRGSIDWGATIAYRARIGGAETEYVVRPAQRVFDTPENRALAYLLERLDVTMRRAVPASVDDAGVYSTHWLDELGSNLTRIRLARRHYWLRDIPGGRPDSRSRMRLSAARTAFYQARIPNALDTVSRYAENPSPEALVELLAQRYFEPERDWKLFELVVALRLARAFAKVSAKKRRGRLLVGTGASPYARYVMPDGAEVRLWYQSWPSDAGPSVHTDARARYDIAAGALQPDLVVQLHRDGVGVDTVLLELKATRSSSYLSQGLAQMLSYFKDRPTLFTTQPSAWLVAPASAAFVSRDADGRDLWVVGDEGVAESLVQRFGY